HDVEVVGETALPVRLAIVAEVQPLAQPGKDVLPDRHCWLLRGSAGAPAGLFFRLRVGAVLFFGSPLPGGAGGRSPEGKRPGAGSGGSARQPRSRIVMRIG